ncbi:MAG: OmpA family protein [Cytophagales bacterium]
MRGKISLISILLLSFQFLLAQPAAKYSSTNKKALAHYDKAQMFLSRKMFPEAIFELESAVKKDSKFYEAYVSLGSVLKMTRAYANAKEMLLKALELQPKNESNYSLYFAIGDICFKEADYEGAEKYMKGFMSFKNAPAPQKEYAKKVIENCEFAKEQTTNPLKIETKPMPPPLNQFPLQYFPSMTADGSTLVFTALNSFSVQDDENLYVSNHSDKGWSVPTSISSNINTKNNEGTASISGDGKTLVFTSCGRKDSKGSCDLYISYKTGDEWSVPVNMGNTINSPEWDTHPSLSADGRKLYFTSSRRGGFGREDIYVSTKDDSGNWTNAKNLGKNINTTESEIGPFIHANGKTLFFSSNGRPGMGGLDLYYTTLTDTGWTSPVNLGYPLNTANDESGVMIRADMKKGYFSANKKTNGKDVSSVLYEFSVPEELRKVSQVALAKGKVLDLETKKPVKAKIELIDLAKNEVVSIVESDEMNGSYVLVLTEGSEYAIYVSADEYLFKSLTFNYTNPKEFDPMTLDVFLEKAKHGSHIVLNNIFFDSGKFEINEKSIPELEKVKKFLTQNPKLIVEISGHTDNIGKFEDNKKLSELRAKSVVEYLVKTGIPSERLKYVGFADKQPISDNSEEQGRQMNRRIEFKIL